MSQPTNQPAKKDVTIKVRVTPEQVKAYENASKGNLSQFIRDAANEKVLRCGHKISFGRVV